MMNHIPVLINETIELLQVCPGGRYIDCTVGTGGHTSAILEASMPGGQVLGIDIDPKAISVAATRLQSYGKAVHLVNENYENLEATCTRYNFFPVHGILFDLGVSSCQLDSPTRGFSFRFDAPLDMRFSPTQEITAADILNNLSEGELTSLLENYGEEPKSRQIAREIISNRPITTTLQLVAMVEQAIRWKPGRIHPATRTFQALRITVNQELKHLELALKQAINLLGYRGRLVVISYHSLEDRLVKELFRRESRGCLCPPDVPVCNCGHMPTLKLVNKKATIPSLSEVKTNPRSRSAKLRAAERL